MTFSRRHFGRLAAATLALTLVSGAEAADKKVVVGYQTDAQPSALAIANGDFAKATGTQIDFCKFNSGAEIFAAIASGDVQIGYVGSSPFAAATSRGLDVKAFYINDASGPSEALVVRNGSGINSLADLKGKKLAAAPVSTDHYQLLALIKSLGLTEKDVQVFAIPQYEIVAAYQRGDLDGQNAKQIAGLFGGKPEDHAAALKDVAFVPVKAQASEAWLGGGDKSGVAKILKDTAAFLKEQKKISDVLPSYGAFVSADYVTPLTN